MGKTLPSEKAGKAFPTKGTALIKYGGIERALQSRCHTFT